MGNKSGDKHNKNSSYGVGGKNNTQGSSLAKALREEEEMMEKITGYKLKIVERAGDSLGGLLHKSNQREPKLQ